jgi:hypothetical protein
VLFERAEDAQLYKDAYEGAQRIIRISDEVRITMERVTSGTAEVADVATDAAIEGETAASGKLPPSRSRRGTDGRPHSFLSVPLPLDTFRLKVSATHSRLRGNGQESNSWPSLVSARTSFGRRTSAWIDGVCLRAFRRWKPRPTTIANSPSRT